MEHISQALARAIRIPPANEEAHGSPQTAGPKDQQQQLDFPTSSEVCKPFATLRARLALLGFSLIELSDGTYLACRWNLSRPLRDLRAVAQFVRQVGGRE